MKAVTSFDPFTKVLNGLFTFLNRLNINTTKRSTVYLTDDYVLRNVH